MPDYRERCWSIPGLVGAAIEFIAVGADAAAMAAATAAGIKSALGSHLAARGITATATVSVITGRDATYSYYDVEFTGESVKVNRIHKFEFAEGAPDDYYLRMTTSLSWNKITGGLHIDLNDPPYRSGVLRYPWKIFSPGFHGKCESW